MQHIVNWKIYRLSCLDGHFLWSMVLASIAGMSAQLMPRNTFFQYVKQSIGDSGRPTKNIEELKESIWFEPVKLDE